MITSGSYHVDVFHCVTQAKTLGMDAGVPLLCSTFGMLASTAEALIHGGITWSVQIDETTGEQVLHLGDASCSSHLHS